MSAEILDLMKNRDKYMYSFKKHNSQEDFKNNCKLRNKVNRYISLAKADYFLNKVEENRFDSKKLWQQLKFWDIKINQMKALKLF